VEGLPDGAFTMEIAALQRTGGHDGRLISEMALYSLNSTPKKKRFSY